MKLRENQKRNLHCAGGVKAVQFTFISSSSQANEANLQLALKIVSTHCRRFVSKNPRGKMKNRSIKMFKRRMAYFFFLFAVLAQQ